MRFFNVSVSPVGGKYDGNEYPVIRGEYTFASDDLPDFVKDLEPILLEEGFEEIQITITVRNAPTPYRPKKVYVESHTRSYPKRK